MTTPAAPPPLRAVADGEMAVLIVCREPFTFALGHPMRSARCVICLEKIGAQPATVLGAAALAGKACRCGGIVSDAFLAHAAHLPMPSADLQAAMTRGLRCNIVHE